MTGEEAKHIAELLGQILNGNAVGFFIMVAALVALAYAVMRLWSMVEKRLADCERQHEECQKRNRELSQAVLDLAEGRSWEAKGRIEAVQMMAAGR